MPPRGRFGRGDEADPGQLPEEADPGLGHSSAPRDGRRPRRGRGRGSHTPNTWDGTVYYIGRTGRVVVVSVDIVVASLAEKPQSEADHLFTAPILDVLSLV